MNEERFTGKADYYSKYRPSYPVELIDFLYSEAGFNKNSRIADIGAGTGILTKLLLERGSAIYAVEPNTDMRKEAETALISHPNYTSITASAENTTLPDISMDFITVAQAFHWFDEARFKQECKRILKTNGKVALIWNNRDNKSEFIIENNRINDKYCPEFANRHGNWTGAKPNRHNSFFKDNSYVYKIFDNPFIINEESFIGSNLSRSYAPKKGTDNYEFYVNELKELFMKHSDTNGTFIMPHVTECYLGEV